MAVLVLGGYGLIGAAVVDRLIREGETVIGSGRDVESARRRRPDVEWRTADLSKMNAGSWSALLRGVNVVVHAAGALQQSAKDDIERVQEGAIRALIEAAGPAGLKRIVLISAAGATPTATTAFMRAKAVAEAALAASQIDWIVLRPGLVIAPTAYGGTALLRGLAAFPGFIPLVHGGSTVRCIGVDEVAEGVVRGVRGDLPPGSRLDLVEPASRTLADTCAEFRGWLGLGEGTKVHLPSFVGCGAAIVADGLGWLGWRSPLRSTAVRVMAGGVDGDPAHAAQALGRSAATLPEVLRALPSGVQERWFARLWLLKPAILALLCMFWIASGVIGLWRQDEAALVLTSRGVDPAFARTAVVGGGLIDVALGLALAVRPLAALSLKGMVTITLAYLAGSLILAPDLWFDPLGAMLKATCVLALCLVALAVLEER